MAALTASRKKEKQSGGKCGGDVQTCHRNQKPLEDFRPLGDRIAIERDPPERMIGSIVIPDTAQQKLARGTIVAVGPGAKDENGECSPMDVELGDRVIFGKYAGDDVKIEDRDVTIIRQCDVIGIIVK